MKTRTPERAEFLANVLATAIEHNGYGFPGIVEWKFDHKNPSETFAVIYDRYEAEYPDATGEQWRVTVDTIAKGFGVIRQNFEKNGSAHYAVWVRDLMLANRTNGDDGDYDVVGALYVLESAIFGEGRYA